MTTTPDENGNERPNRVEEQTEVKQYRAYCGHNMCDWESEIIESNDRHEAESIGMEKADDHEIMHPTHIKEVDDAE